MVAEHLRVAVGGTLLLVAVDLTDGGLDALSEAVLTRAGTYGPGPGQHCLAQGVELANVAEGEGTQERAERGGGHHPVPEDPPGRTGAQDVGVVDAVGSGHHGVDESEHLAARQCVTRSVTEVDQLVGQLTHPESFRQRGHQCEPGAGHRPGVVEGHCKTRRTVRFCVHRKDAFLFEGCVDFSESHLPKTGGIFRVWSRLRRGCQRWWFGGSRLRHAGCVLHHPDRHRRVCRRSGRRDSPHRTRKRPSERDERHVHQRRGRVGRDHGRHQGVRGRSGSSSAPRFGGGEAGPPPGRTERPYPPKGGVDRTEAAGRRLSKCEVSDAAWTARITLKRELWATCSPSSSSKQASRCSTCGRSSPPGRCDVSDAQTTIESGTDFTGTRKRPSHELTGIGRSTSVVLRERVDWGNGTQWGFLVPCRCNAPTSSCLPWIYLGLPGSVSYTHLPSALRMALHVCYP